MAPFRIIFFGGDGGSNGAFDVDVASSVDATGVPEVMVFVWLDGGWSWRMEINALGPI